MTGSDSTSTNPNVGSKLCWKWYQNKHIVQTCARRDGNNGPMKATPRSTGDTKSFTLFFLKIFFNPYIFQFVFFLFFLKHFNHANDIVPLSLIPQLSAAFHLCIYNIKIPIYYPIRYLALQIIFSIILYPWFRFVFFIWQCLSFSLALIPADILYPPPPPRFREGGDSPCKYTPT